MPDAYRIITNGRRFRAQYRPSGWFSRWLDIGNHGDRDDLDPRLYDSRALAEEAIQGDCATLAKQLGPWWPVDMYPGGKP